MPAQPTGAPAPSDGRIPATSAAGCETRDFSLYVHIPFCSVRCGYCDFNTYATEDFGDGIGLGTYADDAIAEILFAARTLETSGVAKRPMHTVFFEAAPHQTARPRPRAHPAGSHRRIRSG